MLHDKLVLTRNYLVQVRVVGELLHDLLLAADHKQYLIYLTHTLKPLLDRRILGSTCGSLKGTKLII